MAYNFIGLVLGTVTAVVFCYQLLRKARGVVQQLENTTFTIPGVERANPGEATTEVRLRLGGIAGMLDAWQDRGAIKRVGEFGKEAGLLVTVLSVLIMLASLLATVVPWMGWAVRVCIGLGILVVLCALSAWLWLTNKEDRIEERV